MSDDPAQNIPAINDIPHRPQTDLRKVGGVILPSKTWVPFVAGAIGGMSGACLTAPLDVVKTRLQSDFYRDRIQAAKKSGSGVVRTGVVRHFLETGVILRYGWIFS
jgi:solute carrier family 25 protein 33/36